MKIKIGSRYAYQSSHIPTTSPPKWGVYPLNVVAMCISQAIFQLFCSRYVYTFIIYHGVSFTNERREEVRATKYRYQSVVRYKAHHADRDVT